MDRANLWDAVGYTLLIAVCYSMDFVFGTLATLAILFFGLFWIKKNAKGVGIGIAQDMMGKPGHQRIEMVHIDGNKR